MQFEDNSNEITVEEMTWQAICENIEGLCNHGYRDYSLAMTLSEFYAPQRVIRLGTFGTGLEENDTYVALVPAMHLEKGTTDGTLQSMLNYLKRSIPKDEMEEFACINNSIGMSSTVLDLYVDVENKCVTLLNAWLYGKPVQWDNFLER